MEFKKFLIWLVVAIVAFFIIAFFIDANWLGSFSYRVVHALTFGLV